MQFTVYLYGQEPGPTPTSTKRYVALGVAFSGARRRNARPVNANWAHAPALHRDDRVNWSTPSLIEVRWANAWQATLTRDVQSAESWGTVPVLSVQVLAVPWAPVFPADPKNTIASWMSARHRCQQQSGATWQRVYPLDTSFDQTWAAANRPVALWHLAPNLTRQDQGQAIRFPRADHLAFCLALADDPPPAIDVTLALRVHYGPSTPAPINFILDTADAGALVVSGISSYQPSLSRILQPGYAAAHPLRVVVGTVPAVGVEPLPAVEQARSDSARLPVIWSRATPGQRPSTIRWGHGPQLGPRYPPPNDSGWGGTPDEPPPIPVARRVYIIMNDVQVVRLPDGTPIEVLSVDLSASVDAWCWSVRMELADPSQIALLKPDSNGPKIVQITMNSYVWTAIIEGRDRSREHANSAITVTGRSQTALLSDTYTPTRSMVFTDPLSAQQLANREITDRVLPFTVDWRGLDWVVPGGVWYYQDAAPIDVISQIAAARGAVLQSAPGDAQLIVQSRYPVSPWQWSAAVADVALPSDWITGDSAQQQSKPMYDAVIIAGQQQGVLAKITRQASAGQTFAPQVVDQLIVTPEVATERGRNVLADRGIQEQVNMDIPLFPPGTITAGMSGLYAPLLLVDVQDPTDPWQGQTVGVSISARRGGPDSKALEIWQNVSLERHISDAG